MHFALTEEQLELGDAVGRFVRSALPVDRLRSLVDAGEPADPEVWRRLSEELDLVGLIVPEAYGGSGAGTVEAVVVVEQLARNLYPGPYLTTLLVQRALARGANATAREAHLAALGSGTAKATVVFTAVDAQVDQTGDSAEVQVTAELRGVLGVPECDLLLVPVRAGTTQLLAVPVGKDEVTPTDGLDPARTVGDVQLERAPAVVVASGDDAVTAIAALRDHARLLIAAELIGISRACLDMSVEHAKLRQQFGKPLGSFQSIKHRCADMFVELEAAWSATYYAAWAADESEHELPFAARAAYLLADRSARFATAACHQIHGAMGFTWEHDTHLYLKRARATSLLLGDPHQELDHIAATLLDTHSDGDHAAES